jgi:hypothetical protein
VEAHDGEAENFYSDMVAWALRRSSFNKVKSHGGGVSSLSLASGRKGLDRDGGNAPTVRGHS